MLYLFSDKMNATEEYKQVQIEMDLLQPLGYNADLNVRIWIFLFNSFCDFDVLFKCIIL